MKPEQVHALTNSFEGHAQQTEDGTEFWLARDLQHLLGYTKWENFQTVINKAKVACGMSGQAVEDHFPDVRKMVRIGSGTEREIDDLMLTRYACYLIAQNGDPQKQEIAFAQARSIVLSDGLDTGEKKPRGLSTASGQGRDPGVNKRNLREPGSPVKPYFMLQTVS
jgi:DNA-directed RNA polymerase subunit N (RpoN/RPB10)